MQTSFKIDDRVELTVPYSGHNPGSQGTIYRVEDTRDGRDGGQLLYVTMDEGERIHGMFSRRVRAVETKALFKEGDRVELIEDYNKIAFKGEQGTITRDQYGGYMGYLVGVKFDNGYDGGSYVRRLKLVAAKAHEYKEGDRVQVTIPEGNKGTFGGAFFITGPGTVTNQKNDPDVLNVLPDTEHPDWIGRGAWNVDVKFVTPLVEAPFKVGDLVEILDNNGWGCPSRQPGRRHKVAMVDETQVHLDTLGDNDLYYYKFSQVKKVVEVRKPQIGDVIISKREWGLRVTVGTRCVVTRIGSEGALSARVQGSTDTFAWFFDKGKYELAPLVEKPKATPATDTKPRVGDTIVAFWELNGVETRKKGVIAYFDEDGTACTSDGEYITYAEDEAEAGSVFIVERGHEPVVEVKPVVVVPPEQFLLDAPVGSRADGQDDYEFIKTAQNEWSLIARDALCNPRHSTLLLASYPNVKLVK